MSFPGTGSRILLVADSSPAFARVAEILKSDESLRMQLISDTERAAQCIAADEPDIVICRCRAYEALSQASLDNEGDRVFSPFFLLLSRGTDGREIAMGLERGAHDYIEESLYTETLLPKLRSLLTRKRLREELWKEEKRLAEANELLDRNFKELTAILLKILEIRIPGAADRAETAKAMGEFFGQRLGFEDEKRRHLIFAALLHEIGKIGLPDEAICKHGCTLPTALLPLYQQYATVGSMVISTITGYKDSADFVYHQLENYDGSGFPDGLMGEEISVGSRILRAIVFGEDLRMQGCSAEEVAGQIRLSMHTILDQTIANLLIEFVLNDARNADTDKVKVPVDELVAGMVLAEDVYAASGIKLLPKGVQLQEKMLALLKERNAIDAIVGGVYVVMDRLMENGNQAG